MYTDKIQIFENLYFIFSILGFFATSIAAIFVYKTYKFQKEELKLQRDLSSNQQFENTFYNLLNIHREIKQELSLDYRVKRLSGNSKLEDNLVLKHNGFVQTQEDLKGTQVLNFIDNDLRNNYKNEKDFDSIKFLYSKVFNNYKDELGHFMRNTYHILKFIDDELERQKYINEKYKENKYVMGHLKFNYKKYSDIFQSQLNFSELVLIFYNCFEFEKMRYLVEKFDFLENLHCTNLLDVTHKDLVNIGKLKC